MKLPASATAADRRLLPEGRLAGPMPWVIAIMMFLTALAGAAGLGIGAAAVELRQGLGERLTVQIVEANPDTRNAQARAALRTLSKLPEVKLATRVGDAEITRMLAPWFGAGGLGEDVPIPALIDVSLTPEGIDHGDMIAGALARVAPAAHVDNTSEWLGPLARLMHGLALLAAGIVLLMMGATAAAVVLAARGALNTHRATIDTLHLLGATDVQVARLFQRRIALDALFGGGIGFLAGILVILLLGAEISRVGSALLGVGHLPPAAWLLIAILPFLAMALATVTARITVVNALRQML
ncbi:MAG: cell division protein [Sphingomonadaceae bacterium]|nr:cell division protein [Sphingomonadaceae bacterium]